MELPHDEEKLLEAPEQPVALLTPPRSKKKFIIIGIIAGLVVVAGAAAFILHRNGMLLSNVSFRKHTAVQTPVKPASVTLYYSDGKTVLWENKDPNSNKAAQPDKAPYFVNQVRAQLKKSYGDTYGSQGVWKVTTTLDKDVQATAEKSIADAKKKFASQTGGIVDEQATIIEDVPTGQIKALVGGNNYTDPGYGLIDFTQVRIQPGSSIKPFVYAALIENSTNTGAGTQLQDTQGPIDGYPCTQTTGQTINCLQNYDRKYDGLMSFRYAVGAARNVTAVKAGITVGIKKVIDVIQSMGAGGSYSCYSDAALTQESACYQASMIGDEAYLTMKDEVHAYATLSNNGTKVPQVLIIDATLDGVPKAKWQAPKGEQTIRADTAYIMNDVLSDPNASYLAGNCDTNNCSGMKFQRFNGWKFGVVPGLTNNGHEETEASWSSQYAVLTWVGKHSQDANINVGGIVDYTMTQMMQSLMQELHTGKTPLNWKTPTDIKTLPAYVTTTKAFPSQVTPSPATDLYPSWYKQ